MKGSPMTGVRSFLHAFGPWLWMVFASILLILGCDSSSPEVLPERGLEDLIKIGDQLMDPDTREPFSGWVIDFYPEGEVRRSRSAMDQGKLHGLSLGFAMEGWVEVEETFVRGVSHGLRKRYHAKDTLASEESIVDGLLHGETRKWHPNGKLSEVVSYERGMAHGTAMGWHDDGSLKARVILEQGQIVEQTFWDAGEHFDGPAEDASEVSASP